MRKQLIIPAVESIGQGVIDDQGTIGDAPYIMPSMPLPANYEKVEMATLTDGTLVYVVSFDDGVIPTMEVAPNESANNESILLPLSNMQP